MRRLGTAGWLGIVAGAGLLAAAAPLAAEETAARSADAPESVARRIDALVEAAWAEQGLAPTAAASDAEMVRRLHLDLVGTVPTAEQAERYLQDRSPGKRAALVEELIASPGYARRLADLWGEVLVGGGSPDKQREYAPAVFRPWLEAQFAARRPWGELVGELLTATGTVYTNPAVNFMGRREHEPSDLAGAVSKAFLGVQIQCAQCHDHPYEDITQEDFRGMAAFFARVVQRPTEIPYETLGERAAERARQRLEEQVRELVRNGVPEPEARRRAERMRPKSMEISDLTPEALRRPRVRDRVAERLEQRYGEAATATPRFLKGAAHADGADRTRRAALAEWVTSAENPYTARALANRYWAWFLGRGFVHPADDFSDVNIPSVPAALELLAEDTAAHGFDLDRLVRIVTATRAYALSTATPERSPLAQEFFAAGPLKPLTPQQSFDSLQVALGTADDGRTLSGLDGSAVQGTDGPPGMEPGPDARGPERRLLQLAARSFFQAFDDDEGGAAEAFEGTVPQGLFLMNGAVVNGLLTNPRVSVVPTIVAEHPDPRDRVRHLYLRTLSREPTKAELSRAVAFLRRPSASETPTPAPPPARGKRGRRAAAEAADAGATADLLWALIASSEFGSNH